MKLQIEDLHERTHSANIYIRIEAAGEMGLAFPHIPDKSQAWRDLYRLTQDKNWVVRIKAVNALGLAFPHIPDKFQAWQRLNELNQNNEWIMQRSAIDALGLAFPHIPDKFQAWQCLYRLTQDEVWEIRQHAVDALGLAFPHIPDKFRAWQCLHRLTQDEVKDVRRSAINALGLVFSYIPDKYQAQQDLHRLTWHWLTQRRAIRALGLAFPYIPDKYQAWQDLHELIQDKHGYYSSVQISAIGSLGLAFPYIPDKFQAWQDLYLLTQNADVEVRRSAINALGLAFPYIPDKFQAWQCLRRLTGDGHESIRCYAYHALGRASIFKATEAIDTGEFKDKLEDAIEYFDKSSREVKYASPAAFCLPFYRSLHGLLFMDRSAEAEVKGYIAEARGAVETSESKEALLDAVENLSKALEKVRSYTLEEVIHRSKAYTRYCFQTAECLKEIKAKTPYASKIVDAVAIERGIPIIDDKIKYLFNEVEEAAKSLCKRSKGTSQEELDRSTYEKTRGLGQVESPIDAELYFNDIVPLLEAHINRLPKQSHNYYSELIKSMNTATLKKRFEIVKDVLQAALVQGENNDRYGEILGILRNMQFSFSKRESLSSMELRQSLTKLQINISNLDNSFQSHDQNQKKLSLLLEDIDNAEFKRLEIMKCDIIEAIGAFAEDYPPRKDINNLLEEIRSLRPSKSRDRLALIADLYSVTDLSLKLVALLAPLFHNIK